MSASRPSSLKILLLTAVLCLVWGSTWVVIKIGLEDLPPMGSAAGRFTLAALCMSGICALFARREGGTRPTLRLSMVLGSVNFATSYGIVYWTETRLPSALASVLWAVYPMMQAVAGHLFLPGERLRPGQSLGFVLGFLGVVALFATDLCDVGPQAIPAGAILLFSPLAAASGTTYVKRHGGGTSSMLLNRNGMWIGAAWLWGVALASESQAPFELTGTALFTLAYLAVFGTVVAFGLFFWLLRNTEANRLSAIAYVTPGVALVLGWAVLGEPIGLWTLVGLVAILLGVFLVHRGAHPPTPEIEGAPVRP